MLAQALSLFFIKLGVGMCPWLTRVGIQDTGKSFFRLLVFLSFSSIVLGLWANPKPLNPIQLLYALVTFSIYWLLGKYNPRRMDRYFVLMFLLGNLVMGFEIFQWEVEKSGAMYINMLLGALLLGSALTSMVLGHWYLIRPGLSFQFLIRSSLMLFILILMRTAWILIMLGMSSRGHFEDIILKSGDILLLTRFLWGCLLPGFFVYFAYRCAKIHANRSATGILYFSTASIFMGEILADYLTLTMGIPL